MDFAMEAELVFLLRLTRRERDQLNGRLTREEVMRSFPHFSHATATDH